MLLEDSSRGTAVACLACLKSIRVDESFQPYDGRNRSSREQPSSEAPRPVPRQKLTNCPNCSAVLRLPLVHEGGPLRCPRCKHVFLVRSFVELPAGLLESKRENGFPAKAEHSDSASKHLVFVSAKSSDFTYANQVYEFLVSRKVPAFLSQASLPELANSDYRKEIDRVLDEAHHMVVVTSSRENVMSPWVEAEWGMFVNEKRSGRKTGNLVTVAVGALQPADLPPSLRYYEVIPFGPDAFDRVFRYVRR